MKHQEPPFAPTLVVGLGNPGSQYAHTLHNAGIDAIAYLRNQFPKKHPVTTTILFSYSRKGNKIFATPNIFMNESGSAVNAALRRFRVKPAQLLVVHDESDLPLGASRFSFGRGAAGHRGVQSIIDAIGTNKFFRFRIGVRTHTGKAGAFVLKKTSPSERSKLYLGFEEFAKKVRENENP